MTEMRFYHLTRSQLEQALPELLEKTLGRGLRAIVRLPDKASAERLDEALWTARPDSFLPHGSGKGGAAADHPIWLTTQTDNANNADVLFVIDGANAKNMESYQLVCEVFNGNDPACVDTMRERWTAYKKDGHALAYWQQTEKGWTKKSG